MGFYDPQADSSVLQNLLVGAEFFAVHASLSPKHDFRV